MAQVNMKRQIPTLSLSDLTDSFAAFDTVIDVRSPSEFADDHIPGAINLSVLDDTERAEVGTLYKQVDPFTARKLGARLTSENIARHLETLAEHPKTWRPLVYCWRGGQRSGSMALVFHEIGWPVTVLHGGYKAYRRVVQGELEQAADRFQWRLLTGPTGSGKTLILRQMAEHGFQVLDLEGLANHRGSILGQEPNRPQPSQKYFESLLAERLATLSPDQPVWVESESSKVGELHVPARLFRALIQAPALALEADRAGRAALSLAQYQHLTTDPDGTRRLIEKLAFRHSRQQIADWQDAIEEDQWLQLSEGLLAEHYDPAYSRSQKRLQIQRSFTLTHPGVLDADLMDALRTFS